MKIDFSKPQTWLMMAALSIPEQAVLKITAPKLSLEKRLSVSVAMFVIHFTFNGFYAKAKSLRMELTWIIGTALFARAFYGVSWETFAALIAADATMTLYLRSPDC